MEIQRVVEQQTVNPSRLSYTDAKTFPYHFHAGRNPCVEKFDPFSNQFPHTVIYKAHKPKRMARAEPQQEFDFVYDRLSLWGTSRTVADVRILRSETTGQQFVVQIMARKDSLVAICRVAEFTVTHDDIAGPNIICEVYTSMGGIYVRALPSVSLLAATIRRLHKLRIKPIVHEAHYVVPEAGEPQKGIFISRIDPVFGLLNAAFPRRQLGVLMFVNGAEPGAGTLSADVVECEVGDLVHIYYIVTGWGQEWRKPARRALQLPLDFTRSPAEVSGNVDVPSTRALELPFTYDSAAEEQRDRE
jgi:hypothetical protein